MAYHPERHTMDVLIDGKIEERQIDSVTVGNGLRQLNPVLKDNEEAIRTVGSDVPVIVQVSPYPYEDLRHLDTYDGPYPRFDGDYW